MSDPSAPPSPPPAPPGAVDPVDARWLAGMLEMTQEFGRLAVFERDLVTGIARWSAPVFRMLGLPHADPPPPLEDALAHVHPHDRDDMTRLLRAATATPGSHEARFRIVQADGRLRHMHARFDVRASPDGRPVRLLGVLIDDTETVGHLQARQREVEAERERARDLAHRIELVIAAVGVGLWTIDIETDRLEWTPPMYRLYGVGPEGKPATMAELTARYVHPDDRALIRAERARAAAPGQGNLNFVFRIIRPDGEVRALSTWSRREYAADGRLVAYGVTMDVTESLQAQQRIKDLDESALLAAESAGIGTWETEISTGRSLWSAQMYRLRGHSPDCGLTPAQMREATHHPEDLVELRAKIAAAVDAGDDYEHEFRVRWPDGSVRWLASRGIARRDSGGRVTRLIGVNWDVTERRRADDALRDKASAERASRAKSEFLSRMSHELRTPLNAVIGFTQLLLRENEVSDPPSRLRQLLQVQAAGRHLLALIDDVLDVTTVESSTLRLDLRTVPLREVVDEAAQWVRAEAQRAGIALHVGEVEGRVVADERRLRQVLTNLLSNAIKYNRPQGEVWISVQEDTLDGRPARAIRVRDTGRGFDDSQRAHLFEPFNRLGAERENIPGTGIGLVIVHHLAEHMGGRIDVESVAGAGSTFTLRLPDAPADATGPDAGTTLAMPPTVSTVSTEPTMPPAAPPATNRDDPAAAPVRTLSLLYIEDNPVNALLVEEIVATRPNLRLRGAADGRSGVALAQADPPDVALVDMQLPDIDGADVLDALRADPRLARCRVIALSASAMPEDVRIALARGFDDYWTKPIDVNRFLAALDALAEDLAPR